MSGAAALAILPIEVIDLRAFIPSWKGSGVDDDQDFITQAVRLLASCSEEQRERLAGMAQRYGKAAPDAEDKTPSLASDASLAGKSVTDIFPDLKRLHG